jgi:hypothetical protein
LKKILFITSQYRVGERIYPIIPHLAKEYELDLLKVYQMSKSHKWVGDDDLRFSFDEIYGEYFNEVFYDYCDSSKYELIISDDNRLTPKTKLDRIYENKKGPMLACTHGNGDNPYLIEGYKKVFDNCFVFGNKEKQFDYCIPIGIPANDGLINYKGLEKKHILVIINFLNNRPSPFKVNFGKELFEKLDLVSLQKEYNLPIIFKLKSRADENGFEHNVKYLKGVLPDNLNYRILVDVKNDNQLISESKIVISAPSTLAFKPIQLGIPTVLIDKSGQVSNFYDYDGLFDINNDFKSYLREYTLKKDFIENTITGGLEFNSTTLMVNEIKKFL